MVERAQSPFGESQGDPIVDNIELIVATMSGRVAAGGSQEHLAAVASGSLPSFEQLPEYGALIGEQVHATPGAAGTEAVDVEAKRSGLSINCVVDVYHGDFKRFPHLNAIERQKLYEQVKQAIPDAGTLDAFILLVLTHDIGKNDDVRRDVEAGPEIDHDEVFTRLVINPRYEAARRRYMPSYDLLTPNGQRLLSGVARMRTNYPQLLQAEAPGETIADFHNEPDKQIKLLDILKAKFDIFGAAGHVNADVSLTATTATARRMHNLDTALLRTDLTTPQDRNNAFLDAEIDHFMPGVEPESEQQRADLRALARLECALRIIDQEGFDELRAKVDGLAPVSDAVLVHELNRLKRGTLAYYSPFCCAR